MQASRTAPDVPIEALIRAIPDFPIPGILFRDITPLLKDADRLSRRRSICSRSASKPNESTHVVAIEARGYMLGAPLAYRLRTGFVPVRKPGKLPGRTHVEEYALEYGTNSLEIHDDAVGRGDRVLVVDDLLATGGTAAATARLLTRLGATIVGFAFLIELQALGGRRAERVRCHDVRSVLMLLARRVSLRLSEKNRRSR